jgi:drug/metabolite transporter (DMT)-like permease
VAEAERLPVLGLVQLAASVVLLASAWPVTKQAITLGASPIWFAVGRAGLSTLAALALLAAMRRVRLPGRRDMPALLGVGLLQLAAFFAFAHLAVAWVPAGRTAVLSNVTTIFVVPLSMLVLKEHIPPRRWVAAGLGVVGVVVLMGPWAIDWSRPEVLIGHLFLLAAAAAFSLAIIIVRRFPPALSMFQLLPWCFGLATCVLVPLALVHGGGVGDWPGPALGALGYIGGLAGPVGTWCVMEAAAGLPAMVSSVGFLMTPAAGLLLATWWLGEPLGADLLAGTALILGGVGFAAWPRRPAARKQP